MMQRTAGLDAPTYSVTVSGVSTEDAALYGTARAGVGNAIHAVAEALRDLGDAPDFTVTLSRDTGAVSLTADES